MCFVGVEMEVAGRTDDSEDASKETESMYKVRRGGGKVVAVSTPKAAVWRYRGGHETNYGGKGECKEWH